MVRRMDTLEQMAEIARGFVGKRLRYTDLAATPDAAIPQVGSDVF